MSPRLLTDAADLLTLEALSAHLRVSKKTLKALGRTPLDRGGLPVFRLTPHGPLYVLWSEVAVWILDRRTLTSAKVSSGMFGPGPGHDPAETQPTPRRPSKPALPLARAASLHP